MYRAIRGRYLRKDNNWTEKFREITHNKDVEVYYDNGIRRYLLYYKGKFNMELGRSVTSADISRASLHFKRLRSGNRYEDELKKLSELDDSESKTEEKFFEEMDNEAIGEMHYVLHSPVSFVIGGKGK